MGEIIHENIKIYYFELIFCTHGTWDKAQTIASDNLLIFPILIQC